MTKRNENSKTIFHGLKHKKPIQCRRKAYRDFLIYLEWDDYVKSYFQTDMHIVLHHGKNKDKCVPIDFQVERFGNRTELVHLFSGDRFDEEIWSLANRCAHSLNMEFVPFRVTDVLEEPRRSNLEFLWQYARYEILAVHVALMNSFFAAENRRTLGELKQLFEAHGMDHAAIYSFIFRGAIYASIEDNSLNEQTALCRNSQYKFAFDSQLSGKNEEDLF